MLYRAFYPSPCGDILLESDGENLTGLSFLGGEGADPARLRAGTAVPVLEAAVFWLDRYFQGEAPAADLPLKVSGTPFQGQVWAILREIPYGETLSYGEVAAVIGEKRGGKTGLLARAVGSAAGRNPVALLIPCHRLIAADGSLGGYAYGSEIKRCLLDLEGASFRA